MACASKSRRPSSSIPGSASDPSSPDDSSAFHTRGEPVLLTPNCLSRAVVKPGLDLADPSYALKRVRDRRLRPRASSKRGSNGLEHVLREDVRGSITNESRLATQVLTLGTEGMVRRLSVAAMGEASLQYRLLGRAPDTGGEFSLVVVDLGCQGFARKDCSLAIAAKIEGPR